MKIISIESSCDETSVAVVEGREVLSNIVASQVEEHKIYGGVVPEIASRNHVQNIDGVVKAAIDEAGICIKDIDYVAVTYGAGLVGALLVLAVAYVLFKKKYYHLHEEYLAGLKRR